MHIIKFIPKIQSIAWVACTAVIVIVVKICNPTMMQHMQFDSFDLLLSLPHSRDSDESHVIVVDMDQRSWDRGQLANAVETSHQRGAAAVVIVPIVGQSNTNQRLIASLGKSNTVIAQQLVMSYDSGADASGNNPLEWVAGWMQVARPGPAMASAATGIGFDLLTADADQVTRRMTLAVSVDDQILLGLPIWALKVATGQSDYWLRTGPAGVEHVMIAGQPPIATDPRATAWINWNTNFERHHLTHMRSAADWTGKIVVIGLDTAQTVPTPIGHLLPHVIQAHAIQTLIDGRAPTRPAFAASAEVLAIVIVALAIIMLLPRCRNWQHRAALATVIMLTSVGACVLLWQVYGQLWDVYLIMASAAILYMHALIATHATWLKLR